jgi:hypothetical protein
MSVICHHTMSVDGFIAGPDDSMEWVFSYGEATTLADGTMGRIGAILAGRRWYELALERWDGVDGIYGGAYEGPVFVLTHRPPRESASLRVTLRLGWDRGGGGNRARCRRREGRRDLRGEPQPPRERFRDGVGKPIGGAAIECPDVASCPCTG